MTVLAILPEDTAVYHASVAKPRAGASLSQWTAYWDKSGITAKRLKARADAIQAQRQAEYSARMEAEIEARAKKRAAQLYAEAERERIARLLDAMAAGSGGQSRHALRNAAQQVRSGAHVLLLGKELGAAGGEGQERTGKKGAEDG